MSSNPENDTPKVYKIRRFQIGLNVLVQMGALTLLLVMVNYLAFNHYQRWDYSRDRKYALSETTKQLLKSLKKPVEVVVFFSSDSNAPGGEIYPDVLNLLKEYQYAGNRNIDLEVPVNPFRDLTKARELQAKYRFGANENIVILDCEGRTKFITAMDMSEYDNSPMASGQPPRLVAFKGEQALTAGLLEIVENRKNKVCVLAGHGEPELKSGGGLDKIQEYIHRQNIQLVPLNLQDAGGIPKDARAILILGAKYDFSERELALLKEYWTNRGRLLIAVDPPSYTPRLTAFLNAQGVWPQDDRVLALQKLGPDLYNVVKNVTAVFLDGSPVTNHLKGINTQFFGLTQSLRLDREGVKESNIHLQGLIEAAEGFWGETDYGVDVNAGGRIDFDPKKDHVAPLTLAVSVEKGALNDARVHVDSSRMIVVANAELFGNDALTQPNVDFALSSLNWLMNREELIGIAPKSTRAFTLNLTDAQLSRIGGVVLFLIPGAVALIGIFGWLKRRR